MTRDQLKRGLLLGAIGTIAVAAIGLALQQNTIKSALGVILIMLLFPALGMVVSGALDLYRILCKHRVRSRLRFDENSIASEWDAKGWRPPASFDASYKDAKAAVIGEGEFVLYFLDRSRPWNRKNGDLWFLNAKLSAFKDRETFDRLIGYLTAHSVPITFGDDALDAAKFGSVLTTDAN